MCTAGQQYSGLFHWRYYANIWNTVYFSIFSVISYSVSIFQQVQSMVARTAIDSSFNKTYESMQTAVSDRSDCREVLQCIEATAAHRPLPLLTPPQ